MPAAPKPLVLIILDGLDTVKVPNSMPSMLPTSRYTTGCWPASRTD